MDKLLWTQPFRGRFTVISFSQSWLASVAQFFAVTSLDKSAFDAFVPHLERSSETCKGPLDRQWWVIALRPQLTSPVREQNPRSDLQKPIGEHRSPLRFP
jgi:hypothetical protein